MGTWILIIEVVLLVGASGLCSGLNVALMSLPVADLKRKAKLGDSMARRVLPLRRNSHLTLASILLGNVGVVSATSLVLDRRLGGLWAGLLSTLLIVVFGEIMPQALFARHALKFCSFFTPLMRLFIFATYPISKPLQLLLDILFGKQLAPLHTRGELSMIIGEHAKPGVSELDEDEVEIIRGALQLSEKRVRRIMTPIDRVYWLQPNTLIDADKIDEIKAKGWSRLPIFNKSLTDAHGILLMKDLVDINFDDHPLPVDQLNVRPLTTVGSMTALDTMFRKFIGARSHLMAVERDNKIVGIVTIEDLLEEILGHEIEDETH